MTRPRTLHDRLNRLLHWELRVEDLDRSLSFYEALTPLHSSGIVDVGASRSVLLENPAPGAPLPRLRLVQATTTPEPVPDSQHGIGFYRVVMHVRDLEAARIRATELGAPPFASTTDDRFRYRIGSRGMVPFHVAACHDPDGIVLEFIEHETPKLSVVAQWTSDLDAALDFYRDVLGLDLDDVVDTPEPVPDVYGPDHGSIDLIGAFLRVRGDERGYLDVLQARPPRTGVARPPREHGVVRCAIEVDDLDDALELLRAERWRGRPLAIDPGPIAVDFGGALGRRRTLGFQDPDGVLLQFVDQHAEHAG
jgi:catechol 2,3-dioxygenase-like lactoylglutathione lyase family enzyme